MKTETESMIGKVFYGNNRWHGLSKHTVIRETPTQLVLNDETRIKKQDKYDFTRSVGATGWDCVLYSLATPKLDEVSIHKIAFACTEHILIELYPQPKEIYNFWYAVQEHINSMV